MIRAVNPPPITYCNTKIVNQSEILKGRCTLITGGTSGIGYSIAEYFLKAGSSVIITGRNKAKIDDVVEKLNSYRKASNKVFGVVLDCTKPSTFEMTLNNVMSLIHEQGIAAIDILVNNAGVNASRMPNATEEDYDLVMDTNLKGPFFLSQIIGKYMVKNEIKGNILNIASSSSLRPADSAYTLSKWGLRGLTLGLAKSLAPSGITVNGIAPGPTTTPMMLRDGNTNMYLERIPLGRYITPEEIASMAVVLVSDTGRSIMGDIVYMTGGAGILTYDDVRYNF